MTTQSEHDFNFSKTTPIEPKEVITFRMKMQNQILSFKEKQWLTIASVMIVTGLVFYIPHIVSDYKLQAQKQEAINIAAIKDLSVRQLAEQNALLKAQQIESIKEEKVQEKKLQDYINQVKAITPAEMEKIITFIGKVKNMENKRLNELAWKIRYVHSKDPKQYNTGDAFKSIAENRIFMNDTYNNKIVDLNRLYEQVQHNRTANIMDEQEDFDTFKSLLLWKQYTKLGTMPTLEEIDSIVNDWETEFLDKEGIANYLDKNKNLIDKQ